MRRKKPVEVTRTPLSQSEVFALRKRAQLDYDAKLKAEADERKAKRLEREALCEATEPKGHVYAYNQLKEEEHCVGCGKPRPYLTLV